MRLPPALRAGAAGEAALRAAEVEAERIVALLRIAVALGLMLAMTLALDSVRVVDEPHLRRQIGLAMVTMLSYLAVGVLIYWMIGRGLFKPWMIWLAVFTDCTFLLLNAFLSLVNTGVPGAAIFAMPAVWMAPVVLAFGVLRLSPLRLAVMLVLIAAGFGWMILWQPPEAAPDLVERIRLTLDSPPNFMRLVMLCLAGAVLVVAAVRMRSLLHRSLEEARQKANLTRYLPAQLAERLAGGGLEALQEGRQQQMAILFIDIRGFTSWCEGREPHEVSSLITEFRSRVEDVAGRTSGLIDKYIGDAAMILFEGELAAVRALDCAEGLAAEVAAWFRMREQAGDRGMAAGIGVHWGDVFSGVTGTQERLEYSVFGDTVNTAARLEQLTKEHGMAVIASEALLKQAGVEPARNGWEPLPAEVLRGRSKRLALFGKAQE
ncbi:adenylate/guanylate cyclase domain-containing protein [Leisingera daeponensis]|uniref:Adenylate/guanylate cyclase domain-containing protein n=1 Tax=Leisingera daeponensis TaxID=405746 RepID=A0ABS7NGK9_9RHOB|nr:adenylate/guanylate cyclase domain-containing protein [Leisingera daeponensis]MBY6139987.1 adenylate/guanylate cyclase domain-containing protein [Leisingera daeponensis]